MLSITGFKIRFKSLLSSPFGELSSDKALLGTTEVSLLYLLGLSAFGAVAILNENATLFRPLNAHSSSDDSTFSVTVLKLDFR